MYMSRSAALKGGLPEATPAVANVIFSRDNYFDIDHILYQIKKDSEPDRDDDGKTRTKILTDGARDAEPRFFY